MPFSEGKPQPKIDHEEFLEIADTWGYSEKTIQEIRAVIEQEDIGSGPFLARYKPDSKVAQMEAEAREGTLKRTLTLTLTRTETRGGRANFRELSLKYLNNLKLKNQL